jgi:esterase/lipase
LKSRRIGFFFAGLVAMVIITAWSLKSDGKKPQKEVLIPISPQTSAIIQSADKLTIENQAQNYATHWYRTTDPENIKGVALVIHGLNLRPDKMQAIISGLTDSGIEVLGVSLRGHGDNYAQHVGIDEDQARLETFKTVSFELWINEAYLAYTQVQNRAAQIKVPVFFVGYSLGCLIGLDLFSSPEEVQYDRMVLFAPAIRLRGIHYLGRILSPFSRLVIPSLAPDSYLSNEKGTPIAAYNALFEGLQLFEKHVNDRINVPSLIFIDEEDEFIPVRALKELIKEKKLDKWMLYIVEKEPTANRSTFHHHIIDESSTGKTVWQEMMENTISCLLAKSPH